ncbi:nucleotidyltransferase [Antarcticirhabdus aurantiaca]|uniref:Nucleotidyltransferase n=1 Tax=Antarcticirhabdus aurantiaca TaxID=2606717 RepID=A0ACD4NWS3_9HYPH|nr:nucleotidyltransferase [Antarcticirhabdus aurantiaca]WAJ31220.1 nucleotidyltransferase [Jeongeuplla avenae]
MNILAPMQPSPTFERFLDEVEREVEVSESQDAAARKSYKSVGEWLDRPASELRPYLPWVYAQGSFRLGTAIKPIGDGEYDVDAVCELRAMSKADRSQRDLKAMLGREIEAYAVARQMSKEPTERTRCWTLHYADDAKFHLDVTPCVPNLEQRALLRAIGVPSDWTDTAVSITDKGHPNYATVSADWPRSNPRAYADWFTHRMGQVFLRRRAEVAKSTRAQVDEIPVHRVRTPLQSAIKLLKRHRDVMFSGDPEDAPISIVITTLSAHAYRQEETTGRALAGILTRMEEGIGYSNGRWSIPNPTDPGENFADRWNPSESNPAPKKHEAFKDWLEAARRDFLALASSTDRAAMAEVMARAVGNVPIQAILDRHPAVAGHGVLARVRQFGRSVVEHANHRRRPTWPPRPLGQVSISSATFSRAGFRPTPIGSDGPALPKSGSLRFEARTNVSTPYKIYWQIVNTGFDAERANCLRGRFETLENGNLTKVESTLYSGTHSIECFIVKGGYLAARSGPFIVNID